MMRKNAIYTVNFIQKLFQFFEFVELKLVILVE